MKARRKRTDKADAVPTLEVVCADAALDARACGRLHDRISAAIGAAVVSGKDRIIVRLAAQDRFDKSALWNMILDLFLNRVHALAKVRVVFDADPRSPLRRALKDIMIGPAGVGGDELIWHEDAAPREPDLSLGSSRGEAP